MRRCAASRLSAIGALVVVAAVSVVAVGCGRSTTTTGSGPATTVPSLTGLQRDTPADVSGLAWTDARTGQPVPLPAPGALELVYFGYTSCPDVCPTTLSDLRRAIRTLGPDGDKVSLTFVTDDPERDTAEVLDGYVGSFMTRYHVVRVTDPAELRKLQEPFGAKSSIGEKGPGGVYEVKHTATLYAVDSSGRVLLEWPFGTPSDAIGTDLRILLDRSTAGPGTTVTPVGRTP